MDKKALFADITALRTNSNIVDVPAAIPQQQNINSKLYNGKKKKKKKKKLRKSVLKSEEFKKDENENEAEMLVYSPNHTYIDNKESTMITDYNILEDAYPNLTSILDWQSKPPLLSFSYLLAFLASIDMMVNVPTLYSACKESSDIQYMYAYIFMVYVGCQFLSTFIIGAWMDKRAITEILIFLILCLAIGNVLYTAGVHNHQSALMLIGRSICGIGSCILIIGFAHVTRYSEYDSRENRVLHLRFVIALGTIIGPLIGSLISIKSLNLWNFMNTNNSGSFLVFCLSVAYLMAMMIFMLMKYLRDKKEKSGMITHSQWGRTDSESYDAFTTQQKTFEINSTLDWHSHKLYSKQAFLIWFLYTTAVFSFWSFEAAIIPIGEQNSNMSNQQIYGFFIFIGICYILSFAINKYLLIRWLDIIPEKRVLIALLLMVIGSLFLTSFGFHSNVNAKNIAVWQIIVATPFLTSGFCISTVQLAVLYVKLVGHSVDELGLRMSWFFALASFGLLSGPVVGFILIDTFGSVDIVAHVSALLLIFAIVLGVVSIKMHDEQKHVHSSLDGMQSIDIVEKTKYQNSIRASLLNDRL